MLLVRQEGLDADVNEGAPSRTLELSPSLPPQAQGDCRAGPFPDEATGAGGKHPRRGCSVPLSWFARIRLLPACTVQARRCIASDWISLTRPLIGAAHGHKSMGFRRFPLAAANRHELDCPRTAARPLNGRGAFRCSMDSRGAQARFPPPRNHGPTRNRRSAARLAAGVCGDVRSRAGPVRLLGGAHAAQVRFNCFSPSPVKILAGFPKRPSAPSGPDLRLRSAGSTQGLGRGRAHAGSGPPATVGPRSRRHPVSTAGERGILVDAGCRAKHRPLLGRYDFTAGT